MSYAQTTSKRRELLVQVPNSQPRTPVRSIHIGRSPKSTLLKSVSQLGGVELSYEVFLRSRRALMAVHMSFFDPPPAVNTCHNNILDPLLLSYHNEQTERLPQ